MFPSVLTGIMDVLMLAVLAVHLFQLIGGAEESNALSGRLLRWGKSSACWLNLKRFVQVSDGRVWNRAVRVREGSAVLETFVIKMMRFSSI